MNNDETMLEDSPPKSIDHPDITSSDFDIKGDPSKHDPSGVMNENLKIRQKITRVLASKTNITDDPEMLSILLKTMADNDKSVISTARLKVDEESNNATQNLVRAIVSEAISRGDENRKQANHQQEEFQDNGHRPDFDLPPASREIQDYELKIGTEVLTEEEVKKTIKMTDGNTNQPED